MARNVHARVSGIFHSFIAHQAILGFFFIKTMEFPSDLKRKKKELKHMNKIRRMGSTPIPSHRSVLKWLHLVGNSGGGKNAAVGVGQFMAMEAWNSKNNS